MLRVHSLDLDQKLAAFCATARTNYRWYLEATAGAEENLHIQRKIISGSRAYATLRNDLRIGCVLPPIVIAVSLPLPQRLSQTRTLLSIDDELQLIPAVEKEIQVIRPESVQIIDGLQRTNALRQVGSELDGEERDVFLSRPLHVEVWLNISFSALAYRMLLLNAGQRPMSIKHQVEVLSQNLKLDLQSLPNIEIIETGSRRVRSAQFQLSKLALAFQAWLQGNPNVDVRNSVVEQMLSDSAIETLGSSISIVDREDTETFKGLVGWFVEMDRKLPEIDMEFFGNETVLQGIAAAVGSGQRNVLLRERTERCLATLVEAPQQDASEVLGIAMFNEVRRGIDASKKNVGEATRNLVYSAFQEYFVSDGTRPMNDCWAFAGAKQ